MIDMIQYRLPAVPSLSIAATRDPQKMAHAMNKMFEKQNSWALALDFAWCCYNLLLYFVTC